MVVVLGTGCNQPLPRHRKLPVRPNAVCSPSVDGNVRGISGSTWSPFSGSRNPSETDRHRVKRVKWGHGTASPDIDGNRHKRPNPPLPLPLPGNRFPSKDICAFYTQEDSFVGRLLLG